APGICVHAVGITRNPLFSLPRQPGFEAAIGTRAKSQVVSIGGYACRRPTCQEPEPGSIERIAAPAGWSNPNYKSNPIPHPHPLTPALDRTNPPAHPNP